MCPDFGPRVLAATIRTTEHSAAARVRDGVFIGSSSVGRDDGPQSARPSTQVVLCSGSEGMFQRKLNAAGILLLVSRSCHRTVRLEDVVHHDVPPSPRCLVHDLEAGLRAQMIGNVPADPVHDFPLPGVLGGGAGGGADRLVADHQVDARFARRLPSTDEEVEVLPLDFKRLRGEGAGWLVTFADEKGVNKPLAAMPRDPALCA